MACTETIRSWSLRNDGGSLELPDGWFGRPYDNVHRLTTVHLHADAPPLALDDRLFLTAQGSIKVEADDASLIIGADQLLIEWTGFGSDQTRHVQSYSQALLRLHPGAGLATA